MGRLDDCGVCYDSSFGKMQWYEYRSLHWTWKVATCFEPSRLFKTVIMLWPSNINRAFDSVEGGADIVVHENQYCGPYNKLLYTLFPADSDFICLAQLHAGQ